MVEFYKCTEDVLRDKKAMRRIMKAASREAGQNLQVTSATDMPGCGVQISMLNMRSHSNIYTWSKYHYAAFSMHASNDVAAPWPQVESIGKALGAGFISTSIVERG